MSPETTNKYTAALELLATELSTLNVTIAEKETSLKEKKEFLRETERQLHDTIEAMKVLLVPLMQGDEKVNYLIHPNSVIRSISLDLIREQNE